MYGSQKVEVTNNSVGFLGLLALLFIAGKLTGYIDWSWWLVLLPIYVVPAVIISFFLVIGLVYIIIAAYDSYATERSRKQRQKL